MIRNQTVLVTEAIARDVDTDFISAFNILDSMKAEGFPLLIPRLAFLAVWSRKEDDPEDYKATFTITINKEKMLSKKVDIKFLGKKTSRNIVKIAGFIMANPGVIEFKMKVTNVRASATFLLRVVPPDKPKITKAS